MLRPDEGGRKTSLSQFPPDPPSIVILLEQRTSNSDAGVFRGLRAGLSRWLRLFFSITVLLHPSYNIIMHMYIGMCMCYGGGVGGGSGCVEYTIKIRYFPKANNILHYYYGWAVCFCDSGAG